MRWFTVSLLLSVILLAILPTSVSAINSSANSPSTTSVATSPALKFLDVAYKVIICIVGISATIACFWVGIKYCRKFKDVINDLGAFVKEIRPDLPFYRTAAKNTNAFMGNVLPPILHGLEDAKIAPPGTESKLLSIMYGEQYSTKRSPKELNESGIELLNDSKLQSIIDKHLDWLIEQLEKQNLKSLLDVEERTPCLLRRLEDEKAITHLKNYLYNHPSKTLNDILFVGSLYLRNKYRDKHPEILEEVKLDFS